MARHKAIGVLVSQIYSNYTTSIWNGISEAARRRGYHLITYRGGNLRSDPATGALKKNIVYDNVDFEQVAGLVLVSTSLAVEISAADYGTFCDRFRSKPLVSIGEAPASVPQCLIDNSSGFYGLVAHLARDHGCREFAFIAGPRRAKEAAVRYDAFRRALADNGLRFNEDLLCYGDFLISRARTGTLALLKKNVPFDALAAANDDMAISACLTLAEAGRSVPDDVKVIGFDDVPNAAIADPALSTVRQPLYTQAVRAANMLIDLVEGGSVERTEAIPTRPVVRDSCGCGQNGAGAKRSPVAFRSSFTFEAEDERKLVADIEGRLLHSLDAESLGAVAELVRLFRGDLNGGPDSYLAKLDSVLDAVADFNGIDAWEEILLAIEKGFAERLSEDRSAAYTRLTDGHRKLLGEKSMRVKARQYTLADRENRILRETLQGLSYRYSLDDIHEYAAATLGNRLGIASGSLALLADGGGDALRLVAGFDREGKIDLEACREPYPVLSFVPAGREELSARPRFICPIEENDRDAGVVVLETGTAAAFIYESLAAQLSGSLRGALLVRASSESARHHLELNARIEALVRPMMETIRRVTDITAAKLQAIASLNDLSTRSAKKISQTTDTIAGVSGRFTGMLDIIRIIDDIATTVNLVAINTAIEATHAGEYGAGFKVLAREIATLSESTRRHADDVSRTLQTVVDQVKFSIEASRESAVSFREQDSLEREILDAMRSIADLMRELDEGSARILAVMEGKETGNCGCGRMKRGQA